MAGAAAFAQGDFELPALGGDPAAPPAPIITPVPTPPPAASGNEIVPIGAVPGPEYSDVPRSILKNDRTLVPLRFLGEWLGAVVNYDDKTSRITLKLGEREVALRLGSNMAMVDGKLTKLDAYPTTLSGRTLVPLRFVSEALRCVVSWNDRTSEASVIHPDTGEELVLHVSQLDPAEVSIYTAAEDGDSDTLSFFLAKDPAFATKPNPAGGWMPLHYACYRGQAKTANALIAAGADVNALDPDGRTPLHFAAYNGRLECVKMLLERPDGKGAEIGAKTATKQTALHFAAQRGHWEVVNYLLEKGAEVDAQDEEGMTPFFVAARQGAVRVMQLLMDKGARVDTAAADGATPLHAAAFFGRVAAARLLLQKGAQVNATYGEARTPLHLAAISGQRDMVELLIGAGADVNVADANGLTPLHMAASAGNRSVATLLLQAKANVNAKTKDGLTPLKVAMNADVRNWELESLLRKAGGVE